MLVLLSAAALAAPLSPATATRLAVAYTVTIDIEDPSGQVCALAKMCDCATTYRGAGASPTREGDRVTFTGTWEVLQTTCNDALVLWAGEAAHHSLRFADDTLTSWVVHRDADAHTPLKEGMKAKGQAYVTEMKVPWAADGVLAHTEEEKQPLMGAILITSSHALTLTLAR